MARRTEVGLEELCKLASGVVMRTSPVSSCKDSVCVLWRWLRRFITVEDTVWSYVTERSVLTLARFSSALQATKFNAIHAFGIGVCTSRAVRSTMTGEFNVPLDVGEVHWAEVEGEDVGHRPGVGFREYCSR